MHNPGATARRVRRLLVGSAIAAAATLPVRPAAADPASVKIMMDWIIQGTHSPFFVAQKNGYFDKNNVKVQVDPGAGATNVAVSVAGGAYQFGMVDMPTIVKFDAENPNTPLVGVYMYFDDSPLAIVSRKSAGIKTPQDLQGKRIAGGPGIAVHDTISILLKAAHAENVQPIWVSVQPQLFAPMFLRGEVDALGGFTNSQIPAAVEMGIPLNEVSALKYADFGADMYGMALAAPKSFVDANPAVVKAVVEALNHGVKDVIANPPAALDVMQARDPMMKKDIETLRLNIALGLIDDKYVQEHGLSTVDPARLKSTVNAVVDAYELKNPPTPEMVYSDKFLPPVAERMPPK
jgi:NitT/TauT family transport system substrate-binding protein